MAKEIYELGHLICGRFVLKIKPRKIYNKKLQKELVREISRLSLAQDHKRINSSYSQMPGKKKDPPLLITYVEEKVKPGMECRVLAEIPEAKTGDPFAQNFIKTVLLPAAEKTFREPAEFILGTP